MISLLGSLFGGIWAKLAAAAAMVAAALLWLWNVRRKARKEGRDQLVAEQREQMDENRKKADDARREVRDLDDRGERPPERVRKFYIDPLP